MEARGLLPLLAFIQNFCRIGEFQRQTFGQRFYLGVGRDEVAAGVLIAQWAFDTRPVLLRFHLWLEDVEVERAQAEPVSAQERLDKTVVLIAANMVVDLCYAVIDPRVRVG